MVKHALDCGKISALALAVTFILSWSPVCCGAIEAGSRIGGGAAWVIVDDISLDNIKSHVKFFSSLGTRVTGYEGCRLASEYIELFFRDLGLQVLVHDYWTPIPKDEGSYIIVNDGANAGSNFTAYSLWPNGGLSCISGGFKGKIIYCGEGTLEEMSGLDVNGSIILLDFNSGRNWINAAKLGAKAVIFIEPSFTTKYEALAKGSLSPLEFPRLYVKRDVGLKLKEVADSNGTVTVHVRMRWVNAEARNIVGILEGDSKEDVVIFSAHYDSWSIVPAISPSSEDSIGISILLEMARYFKMHKPRATIWFVAYSGHWEGTVGAVKFVEDTLLSSNKRIWIQLGLDISSESPKMDCLYVSSVYGSMEPSYAWGAGERNTIFALTQTYVQRFYPLRSWFQRLLDVSIRDLRLENYVPEDVKKLVNLVNFGLTYESRFGTQDDFYMLDTEPALSASMMSVTLKTQYGRRISWLSPLDQGIDWTKIWPQVITATTLAQGIANRNFDVDPPYAYSDVSPKRWSQLQFGLASMGYSTLSGKTVEFSNYTGWYEPVPCSLVRLQIYESQALNAWPFAYRYTISGEDGGFVFHGLVPLVSWQIDAWKFNPISGSVEYAVDQGFYGTAQQVAGGLRTTVFPITPNVSALVPLFKCKHVTLFDMIDYFGLTELIVRDYRNPNHSYLNMYISSATRFAALSGGIGVYGFGLGIYATDSKSSPIFYGAFMGADGIANIYVKEGEKITVAFNPNSDAYSWPTMLMSNSTADNPEGNGITVSENVVVTLTVYRAALDMYRIAKSRYESFAKFNIRVAFAEQMLEKALKYIIMANNSYSAKDYEGIYANSYRALQYSYNAYANAAMPLYHEAANSLIFFSLLILPYSVLLEKMIIQLRSSKRFIGILGFALLTFGIYSAVHPAFSVMTNSLMTVISVGVFILLAAILVIFLTELKDLVEAVSVSLLGEHIFKTGRVSTIMHTITYSVESMRKRKMLSALAMITITFVTAAMTAFTSASQGYATVKGQSILSAPYDGVLLKVMYGFPPEERGKIFDINTVNYLKWIAGDDYEISPRVWLYPQTQSPELMPVAEIEASGKGAVRSQLVFLGLSSKELQLIFGGYISGSSIFIGRYDCIMPKSLADHLKINVKDSVTIRGLDAKFTVVGIMDVQGQVLDFDGNPIFPIDPGFSTDLSLSSTLYPQTILPSPVSPDQVVIIPWETALELGGFISSIALTPKTERSLHELEEIAADITTCTNLSTYVGYNGESYGLQRLFVFHFAGWDATITVLLALALLSLVNFMLGTLITRKRDVHVYSTIGLSPGGVIVVFMTEGVTLAFSGILAGYLIGYAMNTVFINMNLLPPDYTFNFMSISVMLSMILIIATVLLASLYPALLASKIVTPSLERRWKIATKPMGDVWEVPIPLKVEHFEALGVLRYLREYYEGAGSEKTGFLVLSVSDININDLELSVDVILSPVEQDITQTAVFKAKKEEDKYQFFIILRRKTGDPKMWLNRTRTFLDDARKQFLLWKGLLPEQRRKYVS
ncbi:MAG: M28 family peptidase [Nitrososphaerota archaeon]|nr:M28 family peptidase [Candidatus Bathyarchaeota archaeon]MDW8048582.1 M28 family peptidase [Nitrososphaerota archaeon]